MLKNTFLLPLLAMLSFGIADIQAQTTTIDFDDFTGTQNLTGGGGGPTNALFSNEGGGAGYNSSRQANGADIDEANGLISLISGTNGGRRTAVESVAVADATLANTVTTFSFGGVQFTNLTDTVGVGNAGPSRVYVGVRNSEGGGDVTSESVAELGSGIFIVFEDSDTLDAILAENPGFNGTSALFAVDSVGTLTVLETFNLDTLNFVEGDSDGDGTNDAAFFDLSPVLDIEFELTGTTYNFSITGDTDGGAAISGSGSLPADMLLTNLSDSSTSWLAIFEQSFQCATEHLKTLKSAPTWSGFLISQPAVAASFPNTSVSIMSAPASK